MIKNHYVMNRRLNFDITFISKYTFEIWKIHLKTIVVLYIAQVYNVYILTGKSSILLKI